LRQALLSLAKRERIVLDSILSFRLAKSMGGEIRMSDCAERETRERAKSEVRDGMRIDWDVPIRAPFARI
jgi:hypothetical protein